VRSAMARAIRLPGIGTARPMRRRFLQRYKRRVRASGGATTCCVAWRERCGGPPRRGPDLSLWRRGFLVLLPEQTLEDGRRPLDRLRRAVEHPPDSHDSKTAHRGGDGQRGRCRVRPANPSLHRGLATRRRRRALRSKETRRTASFRRRPAVALTFANPLWRESGLGTGRVGSLVFGAFGGGAPRWRRLRKPRARVALGEYALAVRRGLRISQSRVSRVSSSGSAFAG